LIFDCWPGVGNRTQARFILGQIAHERDFGRRHGAAVLLTEESQFMARIAGCCNGTAQVRRQHLAILTMAACAFVIHERR
jgi:hypothetical protein